MACATTKDVHTLAGPKKTVFGSVNFMLQPERSEAWLVPASMAKWDGNWMQKWFYTNNPYPVEDDKVKWLRFRRLPIVVVSKLNTEVDSVLEARIILLCKVARWLSKHDLCEEFCMLQIHPLVRDLGITIEEGDEVLGHPCLVLPLGVNRECASPFSISRSLLGRVRTYFVSPPPPFSF